MVEMQAAPAASPDRPAEPDPAEERRVATAVHYRDLAVQHLRRRGALNDLMAALLAGTRSGTVEEFDALSHAHELMTKELGAALVCLGAVADCKGHA